MLFYKLFNYNVDGKLCKAIEAMYNCTRCVIKVNNTFTGWFKTSSGIRQGDTLSPTLFNIFINDLIEDLLNMHCGIETDDFSLSVLCYANDIVVISESEVNLQKMLDYIHSWCRKWRLRVNTNKSKIMHVRPKRRQREKNLFKIGNINIDMVTVRVGVNSFLSIPNSIPIPFYQFLSQFQFLWF